MFTQCSRAVAWGYATLPSQARRYAADPRSTVAPTTHSLPECSTHYIREEGSRTWGAYISEQVCYRTTGDFRSTVRTGGLAVAPPTATLCKPTPRAVLQVCYTMENGDV